MQGKLVVRLSLVVSTFVAGCVSTPEADLRIDSTTAVRARDPRKLDGRVQCAYEHGELLVWGTVEAPHLRRGQVIGHADVAIVDGEGVTWREAHAIYREPVASDPPSAAAVYCVRLAERPPEGWHVVVQHHARVFD